MSHPLNIWCNARLSDAATELLKLELARHRLTLAKTDSDPLLQQADIIFGQPEPLAVIESPKLKWLHLNSAGYTRYDTQMFRKGIQSLGVVVTNSSSIYNAPCAEHVLAMMMALARQLPQTMREQLGSRPWQTPAIRAGCDILDGQTAMIFGLGAIGTRLAELLTPLRMNLIGVRRRPRGDEKIRTITPTDADSILHEADHVINALPETADTKLFFSAQRSKKMKRGAKFYNIGRGSAVDQDALQELLQTNHLAAAYLDVTTPEPLPPDHPLWRVPNCFITPHIGGVHARQYERLARHFLNNIQRFERGQPMFNRVF